MSKKAQGLSMNVIIIAAISLLVLIILAVLVLRAGGGVTTGTSCSGVGGRCYTSCSDLESDEGGSWSTDIAKSGRSGGCGEDEVCCVPIERPLVQ